MRIKRRRRGTTLTELVVAGMLFLAALSIVCTTAISANRIWRDGSDYRFASDLLAGHMEELTALEPESVEETAKNIQLSNEASERLQGSKILAQVTDIEKGKQIRLSLDWKRIGNPPPVSLYGWVIDQGVEK